MTMTLHDAAVVRNIGDAIDATLAAMNPRGVDMNLLGMAFPKLAQASADAKNLYSRILEAYPIIAEEVIHEETNEQNDHQEDQSTTKEPEAKEPLEESASETGVQ